MLVQCEHNGVNRNCNRCVECPSLPAVYVALQLLGFGGKDAHVFPFSNIYPELELFILDYWGLPKSPISV